jgi:hypothetical protein
MAILKARLIKTGVPFQIGKEFETKQMMPFLKRYL